MVRKTKGKAGWFGQSKRHSEASVKGWNSRFGKKKTSLSQVRKLHSKRSSRAKSIDGMKNARIVGKNRYAQWVGNPARFDVKGVDTIAKLGGSAWRKRYDLGEKFYEKYGIDDPSDYIPDKFYYPIMKSIKSGEITSLRGVKKKIEELRGKKPKKRLSKKKVEKKQSRELTWEEKGDLLIEVVKNRKGKQPRKKYTMLIDAGGERGGLLFSTNTYNLNKDFGDLLTKFGWAVEHKPRMVHVTNYDGTVENITWGEHLKRIIRQKKNLK